MATNRLMVATGGGAYQNYGVGNTSSSYREVTRKGRYASDNGGGVRSTGETGGAGTIYSLTINERPNLANTRNRGPERDPSRAGSTPLPIVTMAARATGRLSGSD